MLIILGILIAMLLVYSLAQAAGRKPPKPSTDYIAPHPFRK